MSNERYILRAYIERAGVQSFAQSTNYNAGLLLLNTKNFAHVTVKIGMLYSHEMIRNHILPYS